MPVFVVLEVGGPEHEHALRTAGDLHLSWLHRERGPGQDPDLQLQAGRALELPPHTDDDTAARRAIGKRRGRSGDRRQWMPGRQIRAPWVREGIETVQRIVEGQNLEIRRTLWKYEGLLETQRREFHEKRSEMLFDACSRNFAHEYQKQAGLSRDDTHVRDVTLIARSRVRPRSCHRSPTWSEWRPPTSSLRRRILCAP